MRKFVTIIFFSDSRTRRGTGYGLNDRSGMGASSYRRATGENIEKDNGRFSQPFSFLENEDSTNTINKFQEGPGIENTEISEKEVNIPLSSELLLKNRFNDPSDSNEECDTSTQDDDCDCDCYDGPSSLFREIYHDEHNRCDYDRTDNYDKDISADSSNTGKSEISDSNLSGYQSEINYGPFDFEDDPRDLKVKLAGKEISIDRNERNNMKFEELDYDINEEKQDTTISKSDSESDMKQDSSKSVSSSNTNLPRKIRLPFDNDSTRTLLRDFSAEEQIDILVQTGYTRGDLLQFGYSPQMMDSLGIKYQVGNINGLTTNVKSSAVTSSGNIDFNGLHDDLNGKFLGHDTISGNNNVQLYNHGIPINDYSNGEIDIFYLLLSPTEFFSLIYMWGEHMVWFLESIANFIVEGFEDWGELFEGKTDFAKEFPWNVIREINTEMVFLGGFINCQGKMFIKEYILPIVEYIPSGGIISFNDIFSGYEGIFMVLFVILSWVMFFYFLPRKMWVMGKFLARLLITGGDWEKAKLLGRKEEEMEEERRKARKDGCTGEVNPENREISKKMREEEVRIKKERDENHIELWKKQMNNWNNEIIDKAIGFGNSNTKFIKGNSTEISEDFGNSDDVRGEVYVVPTEEVAFLPAESSSDESEKSEGEDYRDFVEVEHTKYGYQPRNQPKLKKTASKDGKDIGGNSPIRKESASPVRCPKRNVGSPIRNNRNVAATVDSETNIESNYKSISPDKISHIRARPISKESNTGKFPSPQDLEEGGGAKVRKQSEEVQSQGNSKKNLVAVNEFIQDYSPGKMIKKLREEKELPR